MKSFTANPAPDVRQMTQPWHARHAGERVQVIFRGEVIADSCDTMRLDEATQPGVYYFPRKDVRMERLVRSSHESFCPFKGYASYFSIRNGPENAVWSYEDPYERMRAIEGRLAFYADKVDSIIAG